MDYYEMRIEDLQRQINKLEDRIERLEEGRKHEQTHHGDVDAEAGRDRVHSDDPGGARQPAQRKQK